jgi:hypothetical protein
MAITSIEERLTALEKELAQLKQQLAKDKTQTTVPWWEQISGVFKDSPEFEEAVRLGREWREAQRMEYDEDEAPTETKHDSA